MIENDLSAQPDADGIVRIRSVEGAICACSRAAKSICCSLEGECWVHVRDADGQSVYQDLNRSGETVELWGRAPFRIRLGYAPAVSLTYNGRVALRPFTRNDVANLCARTLKGGSLVYSDNPINADRPDRSTSVTCPSAAAPRSPSRA